MAANEPLIPGLSQTGPSTAETVAAEPAGSTGVPAEQPADVPPPVLLPVLLPVPTAPDVFLRRLASVNAALDVVLAGVVLLLAFLLGSVPVRNSDFWRHLAAGRALATGTAPLGVDPATYTTADTYWVNHSWLYDLLAYAGSRALGGQGLVVLKALLLVLLAAVLLRLGRVGPSGWLTAVCTALAVLALSMRVLLQPVCVSYLFLALTLWFLERPHRRAGPGEGEAGRPGAAAGSVLGRFVAYWPLLPLFVLWVNLDAWFLLGPLTVALCALGRALQEWTARRGQQQSAPRGEAAVLGLVLLAGLAVCLLNPSHGHAFMVPSELGLGAAGRALWRDPQLRGLSISPLSGAYFETSLGRSAAGLAYFPLVLLGLLSFALNRANWRWSRALVWLAFFGLSAWHARAIPFFAVVAGPLMALNFGEFFRAWQPAEPADDRDLRSALAGRVLTLLVGAGLLVAAWPGWLQAQPYEPRRWALEPDESLQKAAQQLTRWRDQGQLDPDARGFNFSVDTADYFAWFCPAEKGFLDSSLQVSARSGREYALVRQALLTPAETEAVPGLAPPPEGGADWRQVLRASHVNHLVLSDTNRRRLAAVLSKLLGTSEDEWVLLYLRGDTAIFGWRDPAQRPGPDPFAGIHLDVDRLAFHSPEGAQAPRSWPGRDPEPPLPLTVLDGAAFVRRPAPRSPDRDEAALHLLHFEALRPKSVNRHLQAWQYSLGAGLVAAPAGPDGALAASLRLAWRPLGITRWDEGAVHQVEARQRDLFFLHQDDGPPALLFLAVRAARRALQANPDDATAYVLLGEAYLGLARNTRERVWISGYPLLKSVRYTQMSAALNQALLLKPDLPQAHAALAELYHEMGYVDLELEHRKAFLESSRAAGPQAGESSEQFDERRDAGEKSVAELAKEVQHRLDVYEVNAANLKVLDRVQFAASKGLAGKALELLLASDNSAFGTQGMILELELLLSTGRLKEVRAWMTPELKEPLGAYAYNLFRLRLAAASGAYDEADRDLEEVLAIRRTIKVDDRTVGLREAMGQALGRSILDGHLEPGSPMLLVPVPLNRMTALSQVQATSVNLRQEADLTVLRGLLDLESGRTEEADKAFRAALSSWQSEEAVSSGAGVDFQGRVVAQGYLEFLQKNP